MTKAQKKIKFFFFIKILMQGAAAIALSIGSQTGVTTICLLNIVIRSRRVWQLRFVLTVKGETS
jgi:hypothetical protein